MPYLSNTWVGYLVRSAAQIMTSCLTKLGTKVPEMTDHSPSNPYVRNLEQFSGIAEDLHYYIDNAGRETFITQARLYKSLIQKAREKDYQVIGNRPYTADVQFRLNIPATSLVTIAAGTIISNADNTIQYRTFSGTTIPISSSASGIVSAIQSESVTGVSITESTGVPDFEVVLTEKIVHNSVKAYWDAAQWNSKETLAYSAPADTDFVQTVNEDGNVLLRFGNAEPLGLIPPSGQALTLDYDITQGAAGYVGKGELNKVVSTLTLPANTTIVSANIENAAGGADVESIDDLKRHIPIATRTIKRAVTESDFEAIVDEAPNVQSAGAAYDGRRTFNIYIIPVGGGIASGGLITATQTYIDARKVVGTHPVIKAAGIVGIVLEVLVTAKPSYANADVYTTVLALLLDALGYSNQKVKGSVYLSDLYQVIEGATGVDNSNITILAFKPYARPLNGSTPPLIWSTAPAPTSTTSRWTIQFTNSTTFRLIQGSTLIGTYTTGATVTVPELQFVIPAGAYSNGNTYEFYTYPYNANSVNIVEPSMPVLDVSNIVLNVIGGY